MIQRPACETHRWRAWAAALLIAFWAAARVHGSPTDADWYMAGANPGRTSWVSADVLNPVMTAFLNSSCDKALFGWPCDAEMEKLRDQYARETDPAKQKAIAEAVQVRWAQNPGHIHLGQWYQSGAGRKNLDGFLTAPAPVFWNVSKK